MNEFTDFQNQVKADIELGQFIHKIREARKANEKALKQEKVWRYEKMTPQEELFAKYFSEEAVLVANLNDLDLKSRREELVLIIEQARARLTAIDVQDKERTKSRSSRQGFEVEDEDITSDAINRVKERQKRMSKLDKVRKNLEDMGVPEADIDKIISARNIRDRVDERKTDLNKGEALNPFPAKIPEPKLKPGEINWDKVIQQAKENRNEVPKVISLPLFGKKE